MEKKEMDIHLRKPHFFKAFIPFIKAFIPSIAVQIHTVHTMYVRTLRTLSHLICTATLREA